MEVTELNVAAVVTNDKKKQECTIFMPSHGLTATGKDYMEAYAICIATLTALYHYSREHNLAFKESASYAEIEKMCTGKLQFPTYITLEV